MIVGENDYYINKIQLPTKGPRSSKFDTLADDPQEGPMPVNSHSICYQLEVSKH